MKGGIILSIEKSPFGIMDDNTTIYNILNHGLYMKGGII